MCVSSHLRCRPNVEWATTPPNIVQPRSYQSFDHRVRCIYCRCKLSCDPTGQSNNSIWELCGPEFLPVDGQPRSNEGGRKGAGRWSLILRSERWQFQKPQPSPTCPDERAFHIASLQGGVEITTHPRWPSYARSYYHFGFRIISLNELSAATGRGF